MLVGADGCFQVFKLCSHLEKLSGRFEDLKGLPQQYVIMEQGEGRKQERG